MRFVSVRFLWVIAFVMMALAPCVAQAAVAGPTTMQMLPPTKVESNTTKCDAGGQRVLVWNGNGPIKCAPGIIVGLGASDAINATLSIGGATTISGATTINNAATITGLTKTTGGLVIPPVAVNPSSPALGQIWVVSP